MWRVALLALAFMLHSSLSAALELPGDSDKAVPCRPTVSCTADLAAPGTTEFEGGSLFTSQGSAGNQTAFPILTKFTMAPWSQLQVGSNGYTVVHADPSAQYFDDVTVGNK